MTDRAVSMKRLADTSWSFVYLTVMLRLGFSEGGVCWKYQDNTTGLCRTAIVTNMTYEECCNVRGLPSVSWTPYEESTDVFYLNFLSNGASSCRRCHRTCESVNCFPSKKCRMIDGSPTCVCKPKCDPALKSRGSLCGGDGRTYRNHCHLQRENCKKEQMISIDYYGKCRSSCKRVKCGLGQHCMQDQNGTPHCVKCNRYCGYRVTNSPPNYLCGENGQTYKSTCDLKADMCKFGRSIRIAHFGQCKVNETCDSISCSDGTTCLRHPKSGRPVCVNCDKKCAQSLTIPVCGTDGKSHLSYCHMVNYGCKTGEFITALRQGPCKNSRLRFKAGKLMLKGSTNKSKFGKLKKLQKLRRDRKMKRRRQSDRKTRRKHSKPKRRESKQKRDRREKMITSDHLLTNSEDNFSKIHKHRHAQTQENDS